MKHALVVGHWEGGAATHFQDPLLPLSAIAQGISDAAPGWAAHAIPFGPAETFRAACDGRVSVEADRHGDHGLSSDATSRWVPLTVPLWAENTAEIGRQARDVLDGGGIPVIEGGHTIDSDAGLGFLGALTGIDLSDRHQLSATLPRALDAGRELLRTSDIIVAASTARPLLGLNSVLAVGVDLLPRDSQDRDLTATLTEVLDRYRSRPGELAISSSSSSMRTGDGQADNPGRIAGSGAGGGVGAMVAAIGGRLHPTGDVLAQVTHLDELMSQADLVVVVEPRMHSPVLAEASLDTITRRAAQWALPTVGVTQEHSLSNYERAEWGLHGVIEKTSEMDFHSVGMRMARTWAPLDFTQG
ncbi:glycerate kinase [Schaalia sp. ZJ1691]|uniref:glycerate kinase n=1 Tax=Schaalia sp. ZJ1691 TaxID=2709404 RepID=UPI0013EB3F7E|nr:glycerate kinase [Schaalia sp. ZJ1691]